MRPCDNCFASGDSDGKNGGLVVAIVILLLLLAAAVAFIYVTRVRNAKEEDTAGGSSVPVAFENPMYDEPVQSHNSSMVAMMDDLHTKGLNDNALDERGVHSTQSLVTTDETHDESNYVAVESTANSANVVVVDESLGTLAGMAGMSVYDVAGGGGGEAMYDTAAPVAAGTSSGDVMYDAAGGGGGDAMYDTAAASGATGPTAEAAPEYVLANNDPMYALANGGDAFEEPMYDMAADDGYLAVLPDDSNDFV